MASPNTPTLSGPPPSSGRTELKAGRTPQLAHSSYFYHSTAVKESLVPWWLGTPTHQGHRASPQKCPQDVLSELTNYTNLSFR